MSSQPTPSEDLPTAPQVQASSQPTQPPPSSDELINYNNIEYGFSLDYPKDWLIVETPNPKMYGTLKLMLTSPEQKKRLETTGGYDTAEADIYIEVLESPAELPYNTTKKLSLEEWLKKENKREGGLFGLEETTLANLPAFKALSGSMDEADPQFYIEHKGRIYIIVTELSDASYKARNEKIIRTFRFE